MQKRICKHSKQTDRSICTQEGEHDVTTKANQRTNMLLCVALYILLTVIYFIVAKEYAYTQTGFTFTFHVAKFVISTFLFVLALVFSRRVKDNLLYFIYMTVLILLFLGEAICFTYNADSNPATLIGAFALLLFLVLLQNTKVGIKETAVKRNPMPILLLISIVLFIPFAMMYYKQIDISNLFLANIYETRAVFRESSNPLLGYISAPLSRILLPTLIALSIKNKKYSYLVVCTIMVLFMFLCGALKSVLFGLVAVLFLCNGDYIKKTKRLLIALVVASIIGLLLYTISDNIDIINLIRRAFFVPSRLNSLYANYFGSSPTYLSHSPLGLGIVENNYGASLSKYFGEVVLGSPGLNANVGIITEGFVSFNYIGMILFAFLAAAILHYFRWIKTDEIYAGIILVYIYYINTSFLSVLLLTHGLLFLIVFAYFFMRKNKREEKQDERR